MADKTDVLRLLLPLACLTAKDLNHHHEPVHIAGGDVYDGQEYDLFALQVPPHFHGLDGRIHDLEDIIDIDDVQDVPGMHVISQCRVLSLSAHL